MSVLYFTCDLCKRDLEGYAADRKIGGCTFTSGCYDVSGGYWAQFVPLGLNTVCDCCMWATEKYRNVYDFVHTCGDTLCPVYHPKDKK